VVERQLATIRDIPIYQGASELRYQTISGCEDATFEVAAESDKIHEYYKQTLMDSTQPLKKSWLGDGMFYPEVNPVIFWRKAGGYMQQLKVSTLSRERETQVGLQLCKLR